MLPPTQPKPLVNSDEQSVNALSAQPMPEWPPSAQRNYQTLLRSCPAGARGKRPRLYGLIDSAANDDIYPLLMAEPALSQVQCLFDGEPGLRYRNVAPYLMAIHQGSPLSLQWLTRGWLEHWGIWLCTARPVAELKAHLKKFLFVRRADKTKALFRYYDPRVMEQVLPTLKPLQCGEFFGLNFKPMPDAIFTVRPQPSRIVKLQRHMPRRHLLMRLTGVGVCDSEEFDWQL